MAIKQDVEKLKQRYIDFEFSGIYANLHHISTGNKSYNLSYVLSGLDALEEAVRETGNFPDFCKRHKAKLFDLTSQLISFRGSSLDGEIMEFRNKRKKEIVDNINLYDQVQAHMPYRLSLSS